VKICLVGGTEAHRGGLEAFCDRAMAAVAAARPDWTMVPFATGTAYRPLASLLALPAQFLALRRAARGWDLAWVQVSNLPEACYVLLARMAGLPVLATPHFGANARLQTQGWRRRACRWLLGRAGVLGLLFDGQADEIALPPHVPAQTLGTFLPAASFAHQAAAPRADGPLRLIHAARFSADKGSLRMLELCAALRRAGVPFQAQLVGRGDAATMAQMHEAIARDDLSAQVELVGWLDEGGMQQALRHADVLVHLSSIDSFPLIALEALAADCLPLVYPMAGVVTMVAAMGGMVAEAADPVASAVAQLTATNAQDLHRHAADAGARTRAAYAWPVMVDRLEALARAALDRQAGDPHPSR